MGVVLLFTSLAVAVFWLLFAGVGAVAPPAVIRSPRLGALASFVFNIALGIPLLVSTFIREGPYTVGARKFVLIVMCTAPLVCAAVAFLLGLLYMRADSGTPQDDRPSGQD